MTLSNAISELNVLEKTMHAYRHAMGVLSLDSATCAPAASAPARGETMGVLGEASYKLLVNPRTEELLQTLREHSGDVDATLRRRVEVLWDAYQDTTRIPMDEYVDYTRLCTQADAVWHKAKEESDFASFAPYLEKLVAYNRRFAGYKSGFAAPYDALLEFWSQFDPYTMNTMLVGSDVMLAMLKLDEFQNPLTGLNFQGTGTLTTPLGAKLLRTSAMPAGILIGLDRNYALEQICGSEITVEYDKLIDRQLERAAITTISGFAKVFQAASRVLEV